MRVDLDRPVDAEIWERSTLLAGAIEGALDPGRLRIVVGEAEIPVVACPHPRGLTRSDLHGFVAELVLQRHLGAVRDGTLAIDVFHDAAHVVRVPLRVAPVALELARNHALDLEAYPVPLAADGPTYDTLVFPGLGAVGGSSLNALFRRATLRAGLPTLVYGEADTPAVWAAVRARHPSARYRWIDGHACYAAADAYPDRAARVTLLREPIQRLVSVYNYGVLVHPERFPASFDDFVASGAVREHSQAVGVLRAAGLAREVPGSDDALLSAARAELARGYALIGITEDYEETIFLMCRLAGLDAIGMWWRVLAAPRTVEVGRLAARTRARLERDLAADVALYDEARAAFRERVAAAALGPELDRYRAASVRRSELSTEAKTVECLRWRDVLARVAPGGG